MYVCMLGYFSFGIYSDIIWKFIHSFIHKLMFEQHQLAYHLALKSTREAYYSHLINEGAVNPRMMFKTINKPLKPHNKNTCSSVEKYNKVHKYFTEKIQNI